MPCFSETPDGLLLRSLARGSLKQNLLRALRLWVWLRLLYADPIEEVEHYGIGSPSDPFTFADWRISFFSESHPADEKVPPLHDLDCACAKTTQDWLLLLAPELDLSTWKATLSRNDGSPYSIEKALNQRLFAVTRRSLDEDLRILDKLGWVRRQKQHYYRVLDFPNYPSAAAQLPHIQPLLHPDLVAIAHTLSHPINGHQRFFLHVEYVVPKDATDRVDDWQADLRQIWEKTPVPPIQLTFYSTKLDTVCTRIVYPVCAYYAQRGPYLCAWGQFPEGTDDIMDWRNYRLDRIHAIQPLTWDSSTLPDSLRQTYLRHQLPVPEIIQERMADAWGFDFYQPVDLLLLRFDWDFAKRYINNSLRHETFTSISYAQAKKFVRSQVIDPIIQQQALRVLEGRSPHDAYYTARYRRHDLNILLRLRAWRPHMEVLLPWMLRQQIANEVRQESSFYADSEIRSSSSST